MNDFPKRLRQLREEACLTQEALGKLTDLSRRQIGNFELGRSEPSIDDLKDIADVFNVDMNYLSGKDSKDDVKDFLTEKTTHLLNSLWKVNKTMLDVVRDMGVPGIVDSLLDAQEQFLKKEVFKICTECLEKFVKVRREND